MIFICLLVRQGLPDEKENHSSLPGPTKGAAESMDALFLYILHIFKIMDHEPHTRE